MLQMIQQASAAQGRHEDMPESDARMLKHQAKAAGCWCMLPFSGALNWLSRTAERCHCPAALLLVDVLTHHRRLERLLQDCTLQHAIADVLTKMTVPA